MSQWWGAPKRTEGAVTGLAATAQIEAVSLVWTPPLGLSTPITDYRFDVTDIETGVTTEWVHAPSSSAAATIPLTAGRPRVYTITVRPVSGAGLGAAAQVGVTSLTGLAGPPTAFAGVSGNGSVALSWVAPASQPRPVTGYLVEWWDGTWHTYSTVAGLAATVALPAGFYQFRVTAMNSSGAGGTVEGVGKYSMMTRTQLFTGAGTWVRPHADVTTVDVWIVAGGGNTDIDLYRAGGGGGGGVWHNAAYAVGGNIAVTFEGQSSVASAQGGNVAFGALVAPGGGGGGGNSANGTSGKNTGLPANGGGAGGIYYAGLTATGGPGINGGYTGGSNPGGYGGGSGAGANSNGSIGYPAPDQYFIGEGGSALNVPGLGAVGRGGGRNNAYTRNYGSGGGDDNYLGSPGAVYVTWVS